MGIPLEEILGLEGNKYEKTSAIIKYVRYLAQKHDDSLEIEVARNKFKKITLVAMEDILRGTVKYEVESSPDEKNR